MPKIISIDNIQCSVETPDSSSGSFDETQQDKTEPVEHSNVHTTNRNANALSPYSESKSREVTDYNGSSSLDLFRTASKISNDCDLRRLRSVREKEVPSLPNNDHCHFSGFNKVPQVRGRVVLRYQSGPQRIAFHKKV
ncbi:hypothetical protein GJ496_006836 [Pomphorhynchus laevis]|nr:hypothetical protein GJ496_006836 [Pomphorhynchus laevis]